MVFLLEFLYLCRDKKNLCISQTSPFFRSFKRAKGGFPYSIKLGLMSASVQSKKAEASKVLQLLNLILLCNESAMRSDYI